MWKYWRSNSSSSQPIWKRGKSCPILVKTKAGWENPGGANPADRARGNKAHVDRSLSEVAAYLEMWAGQKSESNLGSLSRAPLQGQGAKGKTDWGRGGGSVWWRQTEASVLSSLPFHTLECNPRVLGLEAPLSGNRVNAKCFRQKCLGCRASEFGLPVHEAQYQWGFHTESSPCSMIFFINTEPRDGKQNWWQQYAAVNYTISSGDSNVSIRSEDSRHGELFSLSLASKAHKLPL